MTIRTHVNLNLQGYSSQAAAIQNILDEVLNNTDPQKLVTESILPFKDGLCIGNRTYPDPKFIILVAMGKAAVPMTTAVMGRIGTKIDRGVCICKALPEKIPKWNGIKIVQGSHPVPDVRSLQASARVREVLCGVSREDLVLVLVSGGSSALVVDPCEGLSLADLQKMNQALLKCGATIDEVNCLRKHVERLKGGGLTRLASPANLEALLLSDVIGNDMSVIASGPTVPDRTTFSDALIVVKKYHLTEELPTAIFDHLHKGQNGLAEETLKPDESAATRAHNTIIGSNRVAIDAAMKEATRLGFTCACISNAMTGEAENAARWFLEGSLKAGRDAAKPFMAVAGGETTVTVRGQGKGGRNLQVALAAVEGMAQTKNAFLVTFATDGEDGPTDAAGAIVSPDTKERARALGLDSRDFLDRNDAYTFFEKAGGLIKTGSTGTNVNDLTFFLQF